MKKILLLSTILIFTTGCDTVFNGNNEAPEKLMLANESAMGEGWGPTLLPFDGTVNFAINEFHDSTGSVPHPYLVVSTDAVYGCDNYGLKKKIDIHDTEIRVEILGIIKPSMCLTALGPAAFSIPLALSDGEYRLALVSGVKTDAYRVTVDRDTLMVEAIAAIFSTPRFTTYWRYPENSLQYVCGTRTDDAWLCDDFNTYLTERAQLTEFTFPENGKVCYNDNPTGHSYEMSPRYYQIGSDEDYEMIESILESYSIDTLSMFMGASISLINWKNKYYYSWLYY